VIDQAALSFGFVPDYSRKDAGKSVETPCSRAAGFKPSTRDASTEYRRTRAACSSAAAALSQLPTDPLSQCQAVVVPVRELAPAPQDSMHESHSAEEAGGPPEDCELPSRYCEPEGSGEVSVPSLDLERCRDSSVVSSYAEPLSPRYVDSGEWGALLETLIYTAGRSSVIFRCCSVAVAKAKAGREMIRKLNQIQHEKTYGRSPVKKATAPGTRPRTASSSATSRASVRSQSSTKPQAVVRHLVSVSSESLSNSVGFHRGTLLSKPQQQRCCRRLVILLNPVPENLFHPRIVPRSSCSRSIEGVLVGTG
jgi:hypothetical protein